MESPRKILWFAQFGGSEFGPMNEDEVLRWIGASKDPAQVYVWRHGLDNWTLAARVPELAARGAGLATAQPKGDAPVIRVSQRHKPLGAERRTSSRHPMIATVAFGGHTTRRILGTCVDVSDDGIQVQAATNWAPAVGETLNLSIQPISLSRVPPFQVLAKVMWINEHEARVGLHFQQITEKDRGNLARYLEVIRAKIAEF